jgi:plastocyanin
MGMSVRMATVLAACVGALSIAFAVGAPAARAATHEVTMSNYAFGPTQLTVHVGDAVTWTNRDTAPHDVTTTTAPVAIHSPTLTTGKSWTYVFAAPGTYRYICSIHPDMLAAVTVLPAPTASTTAVAPPTRRAAAPARSSPARSRVVGRTSASPIRTAAAAGPRSTAPTTPAAAVPAGSSTGSTTTSSRLKPLLLLAGLAAAVATLCLLMLASRPDST